MPVKAVKTRVYQLIGDNRFVVCVDARGQTFHVVHMEHFCTWGNHGVAKARSLLGREWEQYLCIFFTVPWHWDLIKEFREEE